MRNSTTSKGLAERDSDAGTSAGRSGAAQHRQAECGGDARRTTTTLIRVRRANRCGAPLLACVLAGALGGNAQGTQVRGLFIDVEPAPAAATAGTETGARERFVGIDPDLLETARVEAGRAGATPVLRLNLFDDVVLDAIVDHTAPTSAGYSLSGRIEGAPSGSVTLVVNGDVIAGTVRTPAFIYRIRTADDGVLAISAIDPSTIPPGGQPQSPLSPQAPQPPARNSPIMAPIPDARRPDAAPSTSDAEDGSQIGLLFVYTPAAREAEGGDAQIRALLELYAAETNRSYFDSGVIQRVYVALARELDYVEVAGDGLDDLHRLQDPDDGHLDEAHTLRDRHSADIVGLVTAGDNQYGGRAYQMSDPSDDFEALAALYVDHEAGASTVAHELGHIMGLHHDRYEERVCSWCEEIQDRDLSQYKPYPYSFGYVNQRAFEPDAPLASRWRTIMAYGTQCGDQGDHFRCQSLFRFSNPDQTRNGDPLGVPGSEPSTDVAGPADARRTLNETRTIVANFRTAPCLGAGGSPRIRLQASNGQFVTAERNGGGAVNANRTEAGAWEHFQLVDTDGGCVEADDTVYIHTSDNFYLRAEGGGGSTLDATGAQAGPWERFTLRRHGGGGAVRSGDYVTLQAPSGHYIVAETGGGGAVNADRDTAGAWERFRITVPPN